MELKNRSFQYGKVSLAVRTQKHQLQFVLKVSVAAVCTDTCAWSNTPLLNCSVNDVLVEATPLLDERLFQVVDVANPAMVGILLYFQTYNTGGMRGRLRTDHRVVHGRYVSIGGTKVTAIVPSF